MCLRMKSLSRTLSILFAAGSLSLLAAIGVSGGRGEGKAAIVDPQPSADTVALAEGLRLYGEGLYELAREQLMESVNSNSTYIRAESYLYLNALEMDLGNYDAARPWLEKYHTEAIKLFRQTVDAEERISIHREETVRSITGLRRFIVGVVCLVVLVIAIVVFSMRRRQSEARNDPSEQTGPPVPPDISSWQRHLASAEIFMRTPVFAEIADLERQPADRRARVLSLSRQEVLDAELAETFPEFMAELRAAYPSLTAGDVKLCCLSLTGLSTFGRALCFGSTETNVVKQRKHKIKRKLTTDDAGRQLFDFIFSA